ncbi:hypothetical protein C0J52_22041 [Blattella germanica]|nr:hypothetical protein C0J52_22041 [Blattella germanica]
MFLSSRTKVASTHGNHNVYVTDLNTGKNVNTLSGHPRTPWCIAFHPSSNQILASGCLGGQVRVWDLHGGSEIWTAESQTVIASLAFHPTDRMLVIATYNELHFWDWSQPIPFTKCYTSNEKEKVRYVAFDPLGHKLITGISNAPHNQSQWDRVATTPPRQGPIINTSTPRSSPQRTTNTMLPPEQERRITVCYRSLVEQYEQLVQRYYDLSRSRTTPTSVPTVPLERYWFTRIHSQSQPSPPSPPERPRRFFISQRSAFQPRVPRSYSDQNPPEWRSNTRSSSSSSSAPANQNPRRYFLQRRLAGSYFSHRRQDDESTEDSAQNESPPSQQGLDNTADVGVRYGIQLLSRHIDNMQRLCRARLEILQLQQIRRMWEDLQRQIRSLHVAVRESTFGLTDSSESQAGGRGRRRVRLYSHPRPEAGCDLPYRRNIWRSEESETTSTEQGASHIPSVSHMLELARISDIGPSSGNGQANVPADNSSDVSSEQPNNPTRDTNAPQECPRKGAIAKLHARFTALARLKFVVDKKGDGETSRDASAEGERLNSSDGEPSVSLSANVDSRREPVAGPSSQPTDVPAAASNKTPETTKKENEEMVAPSKKKREDLNVKYPRKKTSKSTQDQSTNTNPSSIVPTVLTTTNTTNTTVTSSVREPGTSGQPLENSSSNTWGRFPPGGSQAGSPSVATTQASTNTTSTLLPHQRLLRISRRVYLRRPRFLALGPRSRTMALLQSHRRYQQIFRHYECRRPWFMQSASSQSQNYRSTQRGVSRAAQRREQEAIRGESSSGRAGRRTNMWGLRERHAWFRDGNANSGSDSELHLKMRLIAAFHLEVVFVILSFTYSLKNKLFFVYLRRELEHQWVHQVRSPVALYDSDISSGERGIEERHFHLRRRRSPPREGDNSNTSSGERGSEDSSSQTRRRGRSPSRGGDDSPVTVSLDRGFVEEYFLSRRRGRPPSRDERESRRFHARPILPDQSNLFRLSAYHRRLLRFRHNSFSEAPSYLQGSNSGRNSPNVGVNRGENSRRTGPGPRVVNCYARYASRGTGGRLGRGGSGRPLCRGSMTRREGSIIRLPTYNQDSGVNVPPDSRESSVLRLPGGINVPNPAENSSSANTPLRSPHIMVRVQNPVSMPTGNQESSPEPSQRQQDQELTPPSRQQQDAFTVPLVRVNDVLIPDTSLLNQPQPRQRPRSPPPHPRNPFTQQQQPPSQQPPPPLRYLGNPPDMWRYPGSQEVWRSGWRPRFLHPRYMAPNPFSDDNDDPLVGSSFENINFIRDSFIITDAPMSPNHRIQAWDFSKLNIPDISNAEKNVIVAECKIHNDASVDVSNDGRLLVTLLPTGRLSSTAMLGVYSLEWDSLGQCLYTTSFEQNAVSVSLSPASRHLLVGLASRRVALLPSDRHTMAQIFRLEGGVPGRTVGARGRLCHLRDIEQDREQGYMSLNCIRWAPGPGQGLVYGTNTGKLRVLR